MEWGAFGWWAADGVGWYDAMVYCSILGRAMNTRARTTRGHAYATRAHARAYII